MKITLPKNGRSHRSKRTSVSEILRAAYRKFSRDKFTRRAVTLLSR